MAELQNEKDKKLSGLEIMKMQHSVIKHIVDDAVLCSV